MSSPPTIADIETARARLSGVARETPLYPTETFSRLAGRPVFLKLENLQRTGSFKIRGAYNTIATLSESERRAGVVAASAGNHGQAVAWAAREAGIPATIFMPQDAPMAKVEATRSYGGATELTGAGFEDAVAAAQAHAESTGAALIHAFEDERVIAGQGTIGLELAEQAPDAETVLIPDRRRWACRRDSDGAQGATARRSRPGRPLPAGVHDRRRDRGEAQRRAPVVDPRAASSTTRSRSPTRRSRRRSSSASSERSSSSRAQGPWASRRSSQGGYRAPDR